MGLLTALWDLSWEGRVNKTTSLVRMRESAVEIATGWNFSSKKIDIDANT